MDEAEKRFRKPWETLAHIPRYELGAKLRRGQIHFASMYFNLAPKEEDTFADMLERVTPIARELNPESLQFSPDIKGRINAAYGNGTGAHALENVFEVLQQYDVPSVHREEYESGEDEYSFQRSIVLERSNVRIHVVRLTLKESQYFGLEEGDRILNIAAFPVEIKTGRKSTSGVSNATLTRAMMREKVAPFLLEHHEVKGIGGGSWLFDTDMARELGFRSYAVDGNPYQNTFLWYQLLNADGSINRDRFNHLLAYGRFKHNFTFGFMSREEVINKFVMPKISQIISRLIKRRDQSEQ